MRCGVRCTGLSLCAASGCLCLGAAEFEHLDRLDESCVRVLSNVDGVVQLQVRGSRSDPRIMSHSSIGGSGTCMCPSVDSIIKSLAFLPLTSIMPEHVFSVYTSVPPATLNMLKNSERARD